MAGCKRISPPACASRSSATTSWSRPKTEAKASAPSTKSANPRLTAAEMAETVLTLGEDYPDIRAGVRKICEGFPGPYWRGLDERQDYPDTFVKALTEAGYLAALIPEAYGGAGLPLRAASAILE